MGIKLRTAFVALFVMLASLAHAQGGGTLPIVETGSASSGVPFMVDVNGQGTAGVQFSGTWTGTVVVTGTADCTNYDPTAIKMFDPSATSASSVTGNGVWFFSVAGLCKIQVDGIDTGSADITLRALPITAANGASSGGGGGGGGGTVDQGAAGAASWKVQVTSSALPTGAATSAKQDTGNASLASIDSKITAVDTGAVVVSSSALPSGASTAAKQDTGNTSLASIDGKITAVDTGAVVVSSSALPSGAATGTKQDTGNTSLASIDGKITAVNTGAVVVSSSALPSGAATGTKQDTGNTSLASIDGKITAVNTGAVVVSSSALPSGAATGTKQDTSNTSLASIDGKLVTARTADFDSGAGTVTTEFMGIALPASGGPVAGGTATNPLQVSIANTGANATAVKVDGSAVTQPASIAGNVTVVQATGTNLHTVCDSGCTASVSPADEAAFSAGTTTFGLAGGFFQTTATNNALTTGQMGSFQVTANRALFTNLRNASGTELGVAAAPLQVSLANTASNATGVKVEQNSGANLHVVSDSGSVATVSQLTAVNLNAQVVGPAGTGTNKSGNPVQTGAVFNTTQPTVLDGKIVESQATARGAHIVAPGVEGFAVTATASGNFTVVQPNGANLHATIDSGSTTAVTGNVTVVQGTESALKGQVGGLGSSGVAVTGNPVRVGGVFNTTQPTVTNGQTVDGQSTARGALIVAPGVEGFAVTGTAANFTGTAVGAAASGAAKSGNPVQIGGVFNTTQPTVTTGQAVEAQSTARGGAIVATGADTFNVTVNAALPAGTNAIGKLAANSGVDIGDVDITSVVTGTGPTNLGKLQHDADPGGTVGGHTSEVGPLIMVMRHDEGSTINALTQNNGEYTHLVGDSYGALRVNTTSQRSFRCNISSTATTSTLITGCTSGLLGGLQFYITSMQWSSSIISTTANFMRLQSGTGGSCGTGTTVLYDGYISAAFMPNNIVFSTPLAGGAGKELCFVHASAGTRLVSIQGYIAP
jgi:hypothetical protein